MKPSHKKKAADLNLKYYQDIITLMPGHVYWKDKNGVFLGCNLEQARDAGFNTPDEMIGKTDEDMPWSIQASYLREIDQKVMRSGGPLTLEELFELPDGTKKIYLSSKIPLFDEENQVSGILGISFDITERKRLEEELVKQKELAEAANKAKTEFLENMRHDIRTPLTGIVGFAEIIKNEVNDVKTKEYADNLVAASHMLLEFLNEVLDAIKVLTGDMPAVKKKFSLRDVASKIIQLVKPKVLEKHLEINFTYDEKIPKFLIGDPVRIYRILLELITNALNFTEKGHVTLKIELAKQEERKLVIKCFVEDTGIGIPSDKQDEVFLRFKRLMPSYEGIYKGAGLGLTIVKQFIDDIEGEIYCRSYEGKGSIFTCLIPLQAALLEDDTGVFVTEIKADNKPHVAIHESRQKIDHQNDKTHVLLVEDQHLAAKVAESVITGLGCTVDIAVDGQSTLLLIQENKYDLIFMDVGLPDISGYDLTKRIRAQEWKLDQHVPIVALTAHIDSENKQMCIESGMDAVLSKPLMQNTAQDIINAFVPARKPNDPDKGKSKKRFNRDNYLQLEGKIIDLVEGAAKVNGNKESAKEMINLLIKGFKDDLPKLVKAKEDNDWEAIKKLAHKHHGGSLYCGAPRFEQASAQLENYLVSKKTELREALYQQLLDEMDKLCKETNFK